MYHKESDHQDSSQLQRPPIVLRIYSLWGPIGPLGARLAPWSFGPGLGRLPGGLVLAVLAFWGQVGNIGQLGPNGRILGPIFHPYY